MLNQRARSARQTRRTSDNFLALRIVFSLPVWCLLLILPNTMTPLSLPLSLVMADDSVKSLPSGQITAKRESEIQIDQKTYPLQPNVLVQDEEGRPLDFNALQVGTRVSFHVKNGRIDQIVVALAR